MNDKIPDPIEPESETDERSLLIDSVTDYAIFVLGIDGTIRSWNSGAGRIFGYAADEVLGRHFSILYGEDDRLARKPQHELEVATADDRIEDEGWRRRKDGTRFWVNTVITALRETDRTLRGFAKVTRDMTERRRAEEKLRQSEEMFRLLIESVNDYAIFMLDPSGRIISWNSGAQRMKLYTRDEIIGQHFSIFYPQAEIAAGKPPRELEIAIREGKFEEEGWRLRKDGTRFWANVVITAVRDGKGELRGFAKITRDITDRKRAEEIQQALLEQREARARAEEERRRTEMAFRAAQETNRAKDEFLMTLSHELRTPMTAILGWSSLLPKLNPGEQLFDDAVNSIAQSAKSQARLIEDVLDLSRVVAGKLRLKIDTVEAARILHAAVETVRASADAKSITLNEALADDLGSVVLDPTRLQQIVWNLLANAVKFTPRGGTIDLIARRTASQLEVTVHDTGIGIDPAFLPHIFEPFRQAELPTTRIHGGLGLGLSIVRYLVEAHGGTISAESEGKGKGTTFTVMLPVRIIATRSGEETREDAEVREEVKAEDLSGLTILVVDDDRYGRELVTAVLRRAGATVSAADSVEGAWERLAHEEPDVIMTDIAMPVVDGFTFARALRADERLKTKKLIALTAFPPSTGGVASGFDAYLLKPIDPVALVNAVARAARGK